MELKNVLAVCLISLFSATLVLLIARALDVQTASRLEPQLARIAEQLEAIRRAGGIAAVPAAAEAELLDNALVVYNFHGTTRCPMCLAIESQTEELLRADFAEQLDRGQVVWKVLNYDDPAAAVLAEKFEAHTPIVVLAQMKDGRIEDWRRLDRVLALWDEKPAFMDYVREGIAEMLPVAAPPPPEAPSADVPLIPIPSEEPLEIPVPTGTEEIPIPE